MTTLVEMPKTKTPGLEALERLFQGEEIPGLDDYMEPYVIVERLGFDAEGNLQTRFYTSKHASQADFKHENEPRFRFHGHSLSELVTVFENELRDVGIVPRITPRVIEESTELAVFNYEKPLTIYPNWFDNDFHPAFSTAFNALIQKYSATQIAEA
jgi:hypothetical protein